VGKSSSLVAASEQRKFNATAATIFMMSAWRLTVIICNALYAFFQRYAAEIN
jgi:hypothetical protein